MRPSRLFSYSVSLLFLPLLLLSLTGCGIQEGEETVSSSEEPESITVVANATPAKNPKEQPVLNPEGTAGLSTAVVLFPNGNESLEVGKSYEITWKAQGFNKINIGLEEAGYSRGMIANDVLVSEKKFPWTPSLEDGTTDGHIMHLQIVLSDSRTGEVLDKSDSTFIIVQKSD